uniref:Ladderlectin-like n=1 Tax=Mastacembelus armatus TaxID=205130 RepID=A0A3Q3LUT1_9TELE
MKTLILAALLCALLAQTSAQGFFAPLCEWGWTRIKFRCYIFVPRAMTWAAAQKNCQSMDANLAPVRDSQENGAFQNLIGQSKAAWIGGTDAQQEGKWRWTDGTPFKYTNWRPGQPDNDQGNEDCLHIFTEGRWFWNDLDCQTPLPSVCTKNV